MCFFYFFFFILFFKDFPPLQSESDSRSIPGGRYGCAQFIKICAPEDLRKCSLGRLNLYVQEAINKGLIKYHRTLLVKDYSRDEEYSYLEGKFSYMNCSLNEPLILFNLLKHVLKLILIFIYKIKMKHNFFRKYFT